MTTAPVHVGLSSDDLPMFFEARHLELAAGPAFAHAMTKQMIESEARMPLAEAIEAEAQAQALCMQHPDLAEAHAAFKESREPVFFK